MQGAIIGTKVCVNKEGRGPITQTSPPPFARIT